MKRLTTRTSMDGKAKLIVTDGTLSDKLIEQIAIQRLAEYEDAEEQGLLVWLPCKVGDTLYTIEPRFYNYTKHEGVQRGVCRKYELGENDEGQSWNVWVKLDDGEAHTIYAYSFSSFGKTVFLTREAAEKALEDA